MKRGDLQFEGYDKRDTNARWWRILAHVGACHVASVLPTVLPLKMLLGERKMAGPRRVRKKPPQSVQPKALEEHRRLMEEQTALLRDLRSMIREVSALASYLQERSSVEGRPRISF